MFRRSAVRVASAGAIAAAMVFATGAPVAACPQPHAPSSTNRLTVVAVEFKFTLSTKSVKHGPVVFTIKNKGHIAHDFKIDGKVTPLIQPGKSATLSVKFAKAGNYTYLCTVPGHAAAGMKGTLKVT